MLETATLRSLAMTGLNVDHAWHLCFAKKVWVLKLGSAICRWWFHIETLFILHRDFVFFFEVSSSKIMFLNGL